MKKTQLFLLVYSQQHEYRVRVTIEPYTGKRPSTGASPWALRRYPDVSTTDEARKAIESLESHRTEIVELIDTVLKAHEVLWQDFKTLEEARLHYAKVEAQDLNAGKEPPGTPKLPSAEP